MRMPARKECIEMLRSEGNPKNVIEHSIKVNQVANAVAQRLKKAGVELDLEAIDRASLLHDIAKFKTMNTEVRHGEEGYKILKKAGYPELGKIVKKHALDEILGGSLKTWEEKVVYYADKRVNGGKVVNLSERFNYLRGKYGKISIGVLMLINTSEPAVYRLEREIFNKIGSDISLRDLDGRRA